MRQALKSKKRVVKAYQLGTNSTMEKKLIKEKRIILRDDGCYELFSQEAVHGTGEIAFAGDYFKVDNVDGKLFPYPNSKDWFEANHRHLQENKYEQFNKPLDIWQATDPINAEIQFLLNQKKLTINNNDEKHFFNAFLFGANLSAAKDATIVFYSITRNVQEQIVDIDFNFVSKLEFEENYEIYSHH